MPGSRLGLFVPEGEDHGERLLIAEGLSDTATLAEWGYRAIGRPSCSSGLAQIVDHLRRCPAGDAVVVADADAPGQRGAQSLASILIAQVQTVRVVTPPSRHKDVRAWRRAGASRGDLDKLIDIAPPRRLAVQSRQMAPRRGKGGNRGR